MDKQIERHSGRRGVRSAAFSGHGGVRADFFRWFHEDVLGFDSMEYRRRFWREACRSGRTIGPVPRTALEVTDPRLHPYNEWLLNLASLAVAMGAAAIVRWLSRAVGVHVRRLRRPTYYEAERARRKALADERRRIRRRRTTSPSPSPDDLRAAFAHARESAAAMIRFGSMLEDLECHVDNSVVWNETDGRLVGRRGGIRQWLRENAPDLSERYKTVMKYKALAKKFRQAVGVSDPIPASAVLPSACPVPEEKGEEGRARKGEERGGDEAADGMEEAMGRAEELLAQCGRTFADVAAQLELRLSPDRVPRENSVRTEIARSAGRRRSSA